ncbi:MAG: hypothetical protein AB8B84_15690 [Granulosicoccus sp.]
MKARNQYKDQSGSAIVEYCVVTVVVVAALFMPLPGIDASLVTYLSDALRLFQSHSTMLLSLP